MQIPYAISKAKEQVADFARRVDGPASHFVFECRDPDATRFRQLFMFRVYFDEGENHIDVDSGSYWRNYWPVD